LGAGRGRGEEGKGKGGMNRAKYEPSSACIRHHPGGPNRHHPCSHQCDGRLPSTKLLNSNVCLDGFQSQFLYYFCKVFSELRFGRGLDIQTSVGQVFAALIGKHQCCAGIGFKENMQSLGYCIFYNFD